MIEVSHIQVIHVRLLLILQKESVTQVVRVGAPDILLQPADRSADQISGHSAHNFLRQSDLTRLAENRLEDHPGPAGKGLILCQFPVDRTGQLPLPVRGGLLAHPAQGVRQVVEGQGRCRKPLPVLPLLQILNPEAREEFPNQVDQVRLPQGAAVATQASIGDHQLV